MKDMKELDLVTKQINKLEKSCKSNKLLFLLLLFYNGSAAVTGNHKLQCLAQDGRGSVQSKWGSSMTRQLVKLNSWLDLI